MHKGKGIGIDACAGGVVIYWSGGY